MGYRLSHRRYEEIKQEVVKMFLKYNVCCVPINSFDLALKMGIKIIPYSSFNINKRNFILKKSEDGFSVLYNDQWYIFYNDNDEIGYGRINNTIMHEIAHIILDHTQESDLAEAEVNFFAKYALAPPVLIHKLKLNSPEQISDIFEISYEAGCYSYKYYNTWLKYAGENYTNYELKTLSLFGNNV